MELLTHFHEYLELSSPVLKEIFVNLIVTYSIFFVFFKLNNLIKANTQKSILAWIKVCLNEIRATLVLPDDIKEINFPTWANRWINYFFGTTWFIGSFLFTLFGLLITILMMYSKNTLSLPNSLLAIGIWFIFICGARFFYVEGRKAFALAKRNRLMS
ncbi:hypothetical protein NQ846_17705 [Acinetobacter baumannii]|nr:hypothetical protein [Acinetobacter baumannii]